MSEKDLWQCCICGEWFRGWGNNPYPVVKDDDAQCCDVCNMVSVIPARMSALSKHREES